MIIRLLDGQRAAVHAYVLLGPLDLLAPQTAPLLPFIAPVVRRDLFRHPPQFRLSRQLVDLVLNPKDVCSSLPPSKGRKGHSTTIFSLRLIPASP
jgi:hypothetical protein